MGFKFAITAYVNGDDVITQIIAAGDIYKAIWKFEQQNPNALVTKVEMIKE
jgi:hypothetical protein